MRRFLVVTTMIVSAAAAGACSKSPADKTADQLQKGADSMQKGADQMEKSADSMQKGADSMQKGANSMAKGLEDMAKGLGALTGNPDQKPVDPVSFRDLETVMPDLPGWERGKPTGERMTSPVSYSQATVTYTKGNARIEHKVMDSALNQLLVAPFTMFLTAGYEKETDEGYEKSVKVGEYPGWEKWNSSDKDGELNAVVNGRFIVQIQGHGIDDPKVLHDLMEKTDLKKLASLK
ncbi:MAG: hypothetical protein ACM3SQ_11715 [Betaproteobacteria bacterium]